MKTQKPETEPEKTNEDNQQVGETTVKRQTSKSAFFITPLGGDNSEIRRATDGLIDAVIEPVLRQFGITLIPPHKIKNPGNITRQVVRHILESDIVVANLTGLNANVMYELAIRHAKRKPVIVIAEKGTVLPFDIAAERTIFYQNDMGGAVELMARLSETIPLALTDENPENPVYSGLESSIIQEQVKQDDNPLQSYIVEKIDQLTDSIASIQNNILSEKGDYYTNQIKSDRRYEITLRLKNGNSSEYERLVATLLKSYPDIKVQKNSQGITVMTRNNFETNEIKRIFYQLVDQGFDVDDIETSAIRYKA